MTKTSKKVMIKNCITCGPLLNIEDVYIQNVFRRGRQEKRIICKACHKRKNSEDKKKKRLDYKLGLGPEPACNIKAREARQKNIEKFREKEKILREKAGSSRNTKEICRRAEISIDAYEQALEKQGHVCRICSQPESRKSSSGGICRLGLSMCHKTGKPKAFLCFACNSGLGLLKHDPNRIDSAIRYLSRNYYD